MQIKDVISAVLQVKRNNKRDELEYCVSVCEVMVVPGEEWELFKAEFIVTWQSPLLGQRIRVGV